MRKFYVLHDTFDTYIEAEANTVEQGFLIFWVGQNRVAAFPPGKWDYFKEISIENV